MVWVSVGGGLCVGLWCCVSGGLVWCCVCGCLWWSVGAVSGSLVLSCCLFVSGGLVLSLVVFSGLVVSGSGSGSCLGLWVSGGLCVGLWCCVSGLCVWCCVWLSAGQEIRKITEHEKDVPLNDTSPFAYLHYKILFLFTPLSIS